jgi:hypothetical protein
VRFSDQLGENSIRIHSEVDPTRRLQDSTDASLEHFFRRPIKIYQTEWGTNLGLYDSFDPWSLYFENLRVINRITNYKLLRCKLKLKIVINGNAFFFGRAYAAYRPLPSYDTMTQNRVGVFQDDINLTQLPKIFLDPCMSQGGEMELPFFWYANYLDIVGQDWREMGEIIIRSLAPLQHANGATEVLTISVFAWAEDVELSGLTSVEPGALAPQSKSGDETDRANGKISGPATAISKAAGALSSVSQIAPFAMATSMAAGAVADVASAFGYSRPAIDTTAHPYVNRPGGSLALTNASDQSCKLSVDQKQELSVDPRLVGLDGTDQMTITSIATRECFLTQFFWPMAGPPETFMWNARVDPCMFGSQGSGFNTEYHLTPSCMAALPFKYWTGTMRFRFQIVASSFHRGRIKIVYDPDYIKSNEYNTNFVHIIDIADSKDFTIEISNGQSFTLLDHHLPGFDSVTQMFSTTRYTSKEEGNGVIGVYIVNELTVPNSDVVSSIPINVFVSMGDDFEVFVPDDHFSRFTPGLNSFVPGARLEKQSLESFPDGDATAEPSAPEHTQGEQLNPVQGDTRLINKVYTGESILSFRQMLKRYNLFRVLPTLSVTGATFNFIGQMDYQQSLYPYYYGPVDGAVDVSAGGTPFNYCVMTLWNWISMCYAGVRGGMRYKAMIDGRNTTNHIAICRLNGTVPYDYDNSSVSPNVDPGTSTQVAIANGSLVGINGSNVSLSHITGINEIECPFYFRGRFYPHRQLDWTSGTQPVGGIQVTARGEFHTSTAVNLFLSTAEDFSFYFWVCPPPLRFL